MGAFDEAEVCELIGLCIHSIINESINFESIGPYRYDVQIGAFHEAEVCELIGLCFNSIINESIGPYRYDGLVVLKSVTGSES